MSFEFLAHEHKTPRPLVSVIVAHNRSLVKSTLESLARQTIPADCFEAIVVGDRPEDVSPQDYAFAVCYLTCDQPNPSSRRNLGMRQARAEIFAFIDDDAQAAENWLETGLALFEKDEQIVVLGGPTLLPQLAGLWDRLTYKISHAGFFGNGHENLQVDSDDLRTILGYIICCNMFVHKTRLEQELCFEINIGYGGEDTLFLYQVARYTRRRIFYSTSVNVFHSRRVYGLSYLRSRFRYRVNNGMMIWADYRIYLGNRKFAAGVAMGTLLILLVALLPFSAAPLAVTHQLISFLCALRYFKEDWRLTFLFPPALLLQHIVYYVGVVSGFFSVVFPRQRRRVAQIRRVLR